MTIYRYSVLINFLMNSLTTALLAFAVAFLPFAIAAKPMLGTTSLGDRFFPDNNT